MSKEICFEYSDSGALLIIDYPEEQRDAVSEFFSGLSSAELPSFKLRVLLLCRQYGQLQAYHEILSLNCAVELRPLCLRALAMQDPWDLFLEAYQSFLPWISSLTPDLVSPDGCKLPVELQQFEIWLKKDPNHSTPLMLQTLALSLALGGTQEMSTMSNLIQGLLLREQKIFYERCKNLKWNSALQAGAWWIHVLCAVVGTLNIEDLHFLQNHIGHENLGGYCLPSQREWREFLGASSLQAIQPDIFSAHAFYNHNDLAMLLEKFLPILIDCGVMKSDYPQRLSHILGRIVRLNWDRPSRLFYEQDPLINTLSVKVRDSDQYKAWSYCFNQKRLPLVLLPVVVKHCQSERQRLGELYKNDPDAHAPDLASCLHNLSGYLGDLGERVEALEIIQHAVQIYEGLAAKDFMIYGSPWAISLSSLSICFGNQGDYAAALVMSEKAVKICEELVAREPAVYDKVLAMILNNLSNQLWCLGKYFDACEAIERSVHIYEKLSNNNFSFYGPDFASSLNNLSNQKRSIGRHSDALKASFRSAVIREKFATENFPVYGADFACSLNNLSILFSDQKEYQIALDLAEYSVIMYERLASDNFTVHGVTLANSLSGFSNRLGAKKRYFDALDKVQRSVKIYEILIADDFHVYIPDFAGVLNNLSVCLSNLGDHVAALREVERACELIAPFAKPGTNYAEWATKMLERRDVLRKILRKSPSVE